MFRVTTFKKAVVFCVIILFCTWTMRITYIGREDLTPFEVAIKDALAPLQLQVTRVGSSLRQSVMVVFSAPALAERNKELEKEVASLENKIIGYEEYKKENVRLKELLDYKTMQKGSSLVAAQIIARDPGNWFGTVTLAKEPGVNITKNMPVLSVKGLVGKVISVSQNTAEVMLITDPRSGVGAMVQETRVPGIVEGVANNPGLVRMIHIREDASIEKKQVVITSGLGGGFPKGIPIGRVVEVKKESSGLLKTAYVAPFVNFNLLEEVFVLVDYNSTS